MPQVDFFLGTMPSMPVDGASVRAHRYACCVLVHTLGGGGGCVHRVHRVQQGKSIVILENESISLHAMLHIY